MRGIRGGGNVVAAAVAEKSSSDFTSAPLKRTKLQDRRRVFEQQNMELLTRLALFSVSLQAFLAPALAGDWKAEVPDEMNALTSSCLVIPCTFSYPGQLKSTSQLRGIWLTKSNVIVYHEDSTQVDDNFRGRTTLLGQLGSKNCTLEIDEFKDHDAGSYCFRIEIPGDEKFSYKDQCATVSVVDLPEEPKLHHEEKAFEGESFVISCTVTHTCPAHMPVLTWSHNGKTMTRYTNHGRGRWEVQSTLTFIPQEQDDDLDIICSTQFHGGLKAEKKMNLRVKPKGNLLHIIIPVSAVVGTAALFGGLSFLMIRKYKKHIAELQTRGDNSASVWSRLSRFSRRRSPHRNVVGTSQPERRSFWGRFSSRGNPYMADRNVNYRVNNETVNVKTISKPRFPSPESNRKADLMSSGKGFDEPDDDYVNSAELNIYGNM
ncbi:hypothetical protein GN956_G4374 [Arapaima gigas]